jgi:antitoxin HicB
MVSYPVQITREKAAFLAAFPDIPIAHAVGDSKEACLRDALDALETAFIALMADRIAIPPPSRVKRGMDSVTLPALTEAKLMLYRSMLDAGIRKAELAPRLGWHKPQVDRLLDLRHDSRLDQLEEAFRILGKHIRISVEDAA